MVAKDPGGKKPLRIVSSLVFGLVEWAARNGLSAESTSSDRHQESRHLTGVRGETFAYWYLRRHGYVMVCRNFRVPGLKGEIDLVGFDGPVLAFVEVKTRTSKPGLSGLPEDAVTADKRRFLARMARQFLAERKLNTARWRFDVLAIESRAGSRPVVRLHKGAFTDS
jgi:putative endonuclease